MEEDRIKQRKRVLLRSHHTGMKENDVLIGPFADRHLDSMSDEDVTWFERLLMDHDDIDLYNWMTGREPYPPTLDHPVTRMMRSFKYTP
jgi:antitoxin CptB